MLITSVEPLRFYWYQDGFAKLASEPYSTDDLHNLYRRLTNPDINETNEDAETAVTFISFQKYGEWLRSEGHDEHLFFTQLKELITLTVIAAREALRERSKNIYAETSGCYELISLDCMVDEKIKPWIIECNLSPSLSTYADSDAGANDEVDAKRNMVHDMVNLLGLNNPVEDTPLNAQQQAQREYQQRGQFELLFPATNANEYFNTFPIPRYADIVQAYELSQVDIDESQLQLQPNVQSDFAFDDSITIFACDQAGHTECLTPNDIASWIWLNNAEAISPSEIIQQLQNTLPQQEDTHALYTQVATQVWDVLTDWSHANVFSTKSHLPTTATEKHNATLLSKPINFFLNLGDYSLSIHCFCKNAADYIQHAGQALLQHTQHGEPLFGIDIIPSHYGYSIIHQRSHTLSGLRLSRLLPTVCQLGMEAVAAKSQCLLLPGCQIDNGETNLLLICEEQEILDTIAYHISTQQQWKTQGLYQLLDQQ